jgi:hypothetical protein
LLGHLPLTKMRPLPSSRSTPSDPSSSISPITSRVSSAS